MVEVDNPSRSFLSQRWAEAMGSVVVSTLEGSRPLLVEIQALTTPTSFGLPRRTANGVEFNRLLLVTAVLTQRAGLRLGNRVLVRRTDFGRSPAPVEIKLDSKTLTVKPTPGRCQILPLK